MELPSSSFEMPLISETLPGELCSVIELTCSNTSQPKINTKYSCHNRFSSLRVVVHVCECTRTCKIENF